MKMMSDVEQWNPGCEPCPILLKFEQCSPDSLLQISDKEGGRVAVEILQQAIEETICLSLRWHQQHACLEVDQRIIFLLLP